uniref:Mediator of RNA polymerase II transcription subunit 31 n=1 Tax=Panagrolaimus sp. JU765 TaxID=591449 RepID=A0AC34RJQ0_9BILA
MNQNNYLPPASNSRLSTSGSAPQLPQYPTFQPQNTPQVPPSQNGPHLETQEQARARFEIECEFVQLLANPHYLNYLAQRGYFKEATFVRYLKYLCYFKEPNYARTLKYPQALTFLDLLQKPEFREAIATANNAKFIEDQMLLQWHYYLRKRQRLSKYASSLKDSSPEDDYYEEPEPYSSYEDEPASSNLSSNIKIGTEDTDEPMDDEEYEAATPDEIATENEGERDDLEQSEIERDEDEGEYEEDDDEATQIWLIETIENVCKEMLQFRIHKDKSGINRFSPEIPKTIQTLKNLRAKGVTVELGISEDLWDMPPVESDLLMKDCEMIIEDFENEIEMWFWSFLKDKTTPDLSIALCQGRFADEVDQTCQNGELIHEEF